MVAISGKGRYAQAICIAVSVQSLYTHHSKCVFCLLKWITALLMLGTFVEVS